MQGIIKVKTEKGFGFISRDGEEKDLFFHSNDLQGWTWDDIQVGDKVTFEMGSGDKGPFCKNVARASAGTSDAGNTDDTNEAPMAA